MDGFANVPVQATVATPHRTTSAIQNSGEFAGREVEQVFTNFFPNPIPKVPLPPLQSFSGVTLSKPFSHALCGSNICPPKTPVEQNSKDQVDYLTKLPAELRIRILEHVAYLEGHPSNLIRASRAFYELTLDSNGKPGGGSLFLETVRRLNQESATRWGRIDEPATIIDATIKAFKDNIFIAVLLIKAIVEFGNTGALIQALKVSDISIDSIKDAHSYTLPALQHATMMGNVPILKILLVAGSNVNTRSLDGDTALHVAASLEQIKVLPPLLDAGADVNARDNHNRTPLHIAANRGSIAISRILINAGADVNARDNHSQTALHLAASRGSVTTLKALIKAGANINNQDKNGFTAFSWAANNDHEKALMLLLNCERKKELFTVALESLQANQFRNAADLIQKINYCGQRKTFIQACVAANINLLLEAVKALRSYQFLNAIELVRSIFYLGGTKALKTALLKAKTSINAIVNKPNENQESWGNVDGRGLLQTASVLHVAAATGHFEGILALIGAGVEVNIKNDNGDTPLHIAAAYGHAEAIRTLIFQNANIDIQNYRGWTALHMAGLYLHREAIHMLLDLGANKDIQEKEDDMRVLEIIPREREEIRFSFANRFYLEETRK